MGMFKNSNNSIEAELAKTMQKSLVTSQLENQFSFNKVSKAADYINAAAELLDDTGFSKEANILTKVIEKLAGEDDIMQQPLSIGEIEYDFDTLLKKLKSLPSDQRGSILKMVYRQLNTFLPHQKGELLSEIYEPSRIKLMQENPLDREIEDINLEMPEYKSLAEVAKNITNKYAKKKV